MKICCCCCTWFRPILLGRLIYCFERQDYPNRELVILDDAGQYKGEAEIIGDVCHVEVRGDHTVISGHRWRLVSVPHRFASLGEKRNACMALASDDVEAFAVWDDDDLYLPHALTASVAALDKADWSRPSVVLHPYTVRPCVWRFRQHRTDSDKEPGRGLYHGGWAFSRYLFERLGGYKAGYSGPEDREFMLRMEAARVSQADPMALGFAPFYIYNALSGDRHISGLLDGQDHGQRAWDLTGCKSSAPPADPPTLRIAPPPFFDLDRPGIDATILPRPL